MACGVNVPPAFQVCIRIELDRMEYKCWDLLDRTKPLYRTLNAAKTACEKHKDPSYRPKLKTRTGQVRVMFPDWSVYDAEVVKVDKTWDLAALRILPVTIPSMPLGERPEKGDMVTVGGYGPGWYEAHTGPVVKFYQPTRKDASDLFSVDAMVRSGDSGGPVTKGGQLVGVLFGCSDGTYAVTVDRVKRFLEGVR
jgi:hypothetical protein